MLNKIRYCPNSQSDKLYAINIKTEDKRYDGLCYFL